MYIQYHTVCFARRSTPEKYCYTHPIGNSGGNNITAKNNKMTIRDLWVVIKYRGGCWDQKKEKKGTVDVGFLPIIYYTFSHTVVVQAYILCVMVVVKVMTMTTFNAIFWPLSDCAATLAQLFFKPVENVQALISHRRH